MTKNQKGLTLIEMVITVAIIGIIAAVAWPEYERQKTKNRRSDGINALLSAAQEMQQCHTDEGGYIDTNGDNCTFTPTSKKGYWTIAANPAITLNTFTLEATPSIADAECTTLTITHLGVKGFTGTGNLNRCWSQ